MRHYKWDLVIDYINKIAKNLGGAIYDTRAKRVWDSGQAVCAEAYGPDWINDETFIEWNNKDDSEPPEPFYFDCAKRMADGYIPSWVEKED